MKTGSKKHIVSWARRISLHLQTNGLWWGHIERNRIRKIKKK